jgi:hypothetical protein
MSTITHDPGASSARPAWSTVLGLTQMWASLAIVVMWLAVLFDAIYGPDIITSTAGGDASRVPSAVPIAILAFFGTWVVAKHGFRDTDRGGR